MRANSGGMWEGERKKKEAGNIQCCIEATQVDGECEHKLLSRGKSNPNLGKAAKGAAREAAGRLGGKKSRRESAVFSYRNIQPRASL